MSTLAIIGIAAGVVFVVAVVFAWALCRIAAIADERDAELMRQLRERE